MSLLAGLSQQGGSITASQISDAGTAGKAVLTAETQAQGREALGVAPEVNSPAPLLEYRFNSGATVIQAEGDRFGVNGNLFVCPFQLGDPPWSQYGSGGTVTLRYSEDPYYSGLGARVVFTAGGANACFYRQDVGLTAGSHTLSIWVRSNTGAEQTIGMYNGSTWVDITVPATGWLRASTTFTATAGVKALSPIALGSAGAAVDVVVYGPKIELGALTAVGSTLAATTYGTPPATSVGVDFSGGKCALATVPPVKVAAFTIYAAAKWPLANSAPQANFSSIFGAATGPRLYANSNYYGPVCAMGATYGKAGPCRDALTLKDGLWHVLAGTYDGAAFRLFLDADCIYYNEEVVTPVVMSAIFVSAAQGTSYTFPGEIAHAEFHQSAHSLATVRSKTAAITERLKLKGAAFSPRTWYLAFEGDSISYGLSADVLQNGFAGVAYRALRTVNPVACCGDYATPGAQIATTLATRGASIDVGISSRAKNILFVFAGTNDIAQGSKTAAQTVAALKSYCLVRRAAGWRIVCATPISRTGYDVQLQSLASLIRADSSFYDSLADFQAIPELGATNAYANTTYFNADGIHPNTLGHSLLASVAQAAVTAAALT